MPIRLQRSRKRGYRSPPGTIYVGRPTIFGSPFSGRPGIGHARSVILYDHWLAGQLTPYILARAGFDGDEIEALRRRRIRVVERLPDLAGRNLQCWCPLSSEWCHADVLIRVTNMPRCMDCAA